MTESIDESLNVDAKSAIRRDKGWRLKCLIRFDTVEFFESKSVFRVARMPFNSVLNYDAAGQRLFAG